MGVPYAEVIGDPIAHSKSPAMHRHWLKHLNVEAEYRPLRVSAGGARTYLTERRADPDWRGCNVTSPLKTEVIPHLSALGPDVRSIGAVNTIIHQGDGELLGVNTDAHGAMLALAGVRPQRATLIGAGGAARAVLFALKVMQVPHVTVLNRDMRRARAALDELEVEGSVLPLGSAPPTDLLVNATTLGMVGNPPLPFDLSALPPTAVVFDMVYAPVETDLLARARARGLATVDGLTMLAEQGAMAFAAFFGGGPDRADSSELRKLLTR